MAISSRYEAFQAATRFASLDGVRCLAIVPVVWHHATPRPLEGVLGRGPLGVDLFFVLSGFLITTLLLRERDRRGKVDLRGFYVRRALRIFPLYYAVLALYALHALLRDAGDPIRSHFFESLPFYATYTASWLVDFDVSHPVAFGFSWSLSTEEQYYAVWPSVVALAGLVARSLHARPSPSRPSRRSRTGAALLLPALVVVAFITLDQCVESGGLARALPEGSLARRMASSIATPIGLGSIAAIALHHPSTFAALDRVLGHRMAAPAALALLAACVIVPAAPLPTHLAMTALVVAVTIREDHALAPVLRARPIARIGVVSYGIYLLHVSALTTVKAAVGADAPAWCLFGLALALAWAAAEVSFRFFERPFLDRKARWSAAPASESRPADRRGSAALS